MIGLERSVLLKRARLIASIIMLLIAWELIAHLVAAIRNVPFPTVYETAMRLMRLFSGEPLYGISIYLSLIHISEPTRPY